MMWLEGLPPRYHHKRLAIRDEDETAPLLVHYPIGFDDTGGVGKRVAILNSYLRTDYALLGQTIRYRHAKISSYNRAVDRDPKLFQLKQYFLDRLYSDISDSSSAIKGIVCTLKLHIREIDALAGPEAFYIPQEFKEYLEPLECLVPSKSLQYLADSEHYVDELSLKPGERNSYAFLAYIVNRIKYFVACDFEDMVKVCQELMKSCYLRFSPDRVNSMPPPLRDGVQKIVTDMWNQKKEQALKKLHQEFMQPDEVERQSEKRKEFMNKLDDGSMKRTRKDEGQELSKLEEETDREQQLKKVAEEKDKEANEKKQFKLVGDENEEGEDEENEMISQMWSQMKEEALKKMNDESGEEILCLSDSDLKPLAREFRKKLEDEIEMGRIKQNKHNKKPKMKKEEQLKKVAEEKDKRGKEKDQDKGKYQMHKDQQLKKVVEEGKEAKEKKQLVGDTYTEDNMDNLGKDDEGDCYDSDYPYDTDDSNAEDNPQYDYPNEESSEDKGDDDDDFEEPLDDDYDQPD